MQPRFRMAEVAVLGGLLLAITAAPAAAFPGGNGKIAFTNLVGGRYEAWVMNADGSGAQARSTSGFSEFDLVWSADGSRLAFASTRDSGGDNGDQEVYVMAPDGSGQTRLTTSAGDDRYPTWSPDGTKVAFESMRDGNREIYVMGADGANPVRLTNSPGAVDHHPTFSPDGTKIAYASGPADDSVQVHVMSSDGSGTPVQLTSSAGRNQYPKWSPDGSRIAFASTRDGNFEAYVMNADGSGQTRLTTSATPDYDPTFSPDGTRIAWSGGAGDGTNQIFTMGSAGGPATQLTTGEGAFQPDWQALAPDPSPPAPEPDPPASDPVSPVDSAPAQDERPFRIAGTALTLTRRGFVRVRLRCLLEERRCRGSFTLAVRRRTRVRASRRSRPRRAVIARKRFSIAPGHSAALKVRISRNGRQRVLTSRRLRCRASVVLRAGDQSQTVRRSIVLKRPQPPSG